MAVLELISAVLGFIYVLFIPGFALTWALFPKRGELDDIERLALSVGLSIGLTTLSVMFAAYVGIPLDALNNFLVILLVTLIFTLVAYFRMGTSYLASNQK